MKNWRFFERYFHLSLSWIAVVAIAVAIIDYALAKEGRISLTNPVTFWDKFAFVASILLVFVVPMISTWIRIRQAYEKGLLDRAITASIVGAGQKSDKEKYSHFLREITKADRLNPLELDVDDHPFDDLFDYQATFSITEAPLFAWKNPEYSWFLVTHYISVLLHRMKPDSSVTVVDRSDKSFLNYKKAGLAFVKAISTTLSDLDGFYRFYLLERSEIRENQALLEQLVAGHDLFGIHLFIIDKDIVINNKSLLDVLTLLRSIGNAPNNVLDIMVYKDQNGEWGYNSGKNGRLTQNKLSPEKEIVVNRFIADLARLINENNTCLIYPTIASPYKFSMDDYHLNKKKAFLKTE